MDLGFRWPKIENKIGWQDILDVETWYGDLSCRVDVEPLSRKMSNENLEKGARGLPVAGADKISRKAVADGSGIEQLAQPLVVQGLRFT
jgi:hypothetical protein